MFQRNKQTSDLKLQGRSLALATERPPAWECLLFAQVILDDVEEAKFALSHGAYPSPSDEQPAFSAPEFSSWCQDRMAEIGELVTEIPKVVDAINSKQEDILGPPGQSGNVKAIVSSARQIGSYCKRIVEWAALISRTPVHPAWADVTKEMVAAYALPLIETIERFSKGITQQIENFIAAPPINGATLKFSLNVDVVDTTSLLTAIEEATNTVTQRTEESARLMNRYDELRHRSAVAMRGGDAQQSEYYSRQAVGILMQIGELGILWPPGLLPEKLVEELTEPATQYAEKLRKSRELMERLDFALSMNQLLEGRAVLKQLKEMGTAPAIVIEGAERILGPVATATNQLSLNNSLYPGAGYVYLMVNPSMDGLVKIGKTMRDPIDRAKELGGVTGVPTPFIPIFHAYVSNCSEAEKYIHSCLDQRNCRVSNNREFFRVPPTEAIEIMLDARTRFAMAEPLENQQ
jgi:T5orf172 domain-containing protein